MKAGGLAALAWALWALTLALLGLSLFLPGDGAESGSLVATLSETLVYLAFTTIGAVIAARQPANPIGWIYCAAVLLFAVDDVARAYAVGALVARPGSLPGGLAAAWLTNWLGTFAFGLLLTFPLLLFPTGRLLSPRWRPVAWLTAGLMAVQCAALALRPGPLESIPAVENPAGLAGLAGFSLRIVAIAPTIGGIAVAVSALSLILRFRRAQGTERQQLKWIAYAAAAPLGAILLVSLLADLIPALKPVIDGLFRLAVIALPIATCMAILRYRLFDIDVIIRRTLVYSALTALLALTYFGLVIVLQGAVTTLGGAHSEWVTVASTLAVAALFAPLRSRVQAFIDRRFYRPKYNAAQALADFAAAARDETDLSALTQHLIRIVQATMQPEHAAVWLARRPADAGSQSTPSPEDRRPPR